MVEDEDHPDVVDADSDSDADADARELQNVVRGIVSESGGDPDAITHELVNIVIRERKFAGPLPEPSTLAEYENAVPGLAKIIIDRAEREQAFRHEMTRDDMKFRQDAMRIRRNAGYAGQAAAFIIAMTTILGGIFLAANNKQAGGVATIVSALAALVGVFIYSRRDQSTDEDSEPDDMTQLLAPSSPKPPEGK